MPWALGLGVVILTLQSRWRCNRSKTFVYSHHSSISSLPAGSPVGLKWKRFVFEILLARENRFSRSKRISKTNLFHFNPTGEPASRLLYLWIKLSAQFIPQQILLILFETVCLFYFLCFQNILTVMNIRYS